MPLSTRSARHRQGRRRQAVESRLGADALALRQHSQLVDEIDTRNGSQGLHCKIRYFLRQTGAPKASCSSLSMPWPKTRRRSWSSMPFDANCSLAISCTRHSVARGRPAPQRLVEQSTANHERIRQEAAARLRPMFARRRIEEFIMTYSTGVPVHQCAMCQSKTTRITSASSSSHRMVSATTHHFGCSHLMGVCACQRMGYPDGTLMSVGMAVDGRRGSHHGLS